MIDVDILISLEEYSYSCISLPLCHSTVSNSRNRNIFIGSLFSYTIVKIKQTKFLYCLSMPDRTASLVYQHSEERSYYVCIKFLMFDNEDW